jgi:haloalkane dehalogenase
MGKRIPRRLQIIRSIRPFAAPAVLGLNLFARSALVMAPKKRLTKDVKQGLLAPYNSWQNRIATLKFVQDIPLSEKDPSYGIVKAADDELHRLAGIPMLILWGKHDFVFDMDYFWEWQRRFPHAGTKVFDDAGHYLLEDVPEKILAYIEVFLAAHPLNARS